MRQRLGEIHDAPMAAKPASDAPSPGSRPALARVPTPKAVSDAFARIAADFLQSHASACDVGVAVGRIVPPRQTP